MSFIFIEEDATEFTAADATEEDELSVSGIFIGQTKQVGFRLGNTSTSGVDLTITTSGVNTTVLDDVEYSTDNGTTWDTTVTVSGVKANAITDRILCRYTPATDEYLGVGSFLIRVDES